MDGGKIIQPNYDWIFSMLVDRENPCKLLQQVTKGVIQWIDHFLFGCKVQVIFTAYQSQKFLKKILTKILKLKFSHQTKNFDFELIFNETL